MFPAIVDADTTNGVQASDSSSWTLTYPTNIAAGDLLIALLAVDQIPTPTFPAGWVVQRSANGSTNSFQIAKKKAVGTETGNFTVSLTSSEQGGWRVFRIPAAKWRGQLGTSFANASGTGASVVQAVSSGSGKNGDPGSLSPWWLADDDLFLVAAALDGNVAISGYPLNYTGGANDQGGTTNGAGLGSARRAVNTAAEDPGAFGWGTTTSFIVSTIAVQPARVGAAALTGTSDLSATGTHIGIGAAALTGAGSLSATGKHIGVGAAALTGSGSLIASGSVTSPAGNVTGAAALSGTSGLDASGTRTRFGDAQLDATGSSTVSGVRTTFQAADLDGTSDLDAAGTRTTFATAALAGASSSTIAGVRTRLGAADLTGTGDLTADGDVIPAGVVLAHLTGRGSLTATGTRSAFGDAHLAGAGTTTARGVRVTYDSVHLAGVGALAADGFVPQSAGRIVLTGTGYLTATGSRVLAGVAVAGHLDETLGQLAKGAGRRLDRPGAGELEKALEGRL